MDREPIDVTNKPKVIQRAKGHKHDFEREGAQENGLVAHTCKICGFGLMIDENVDSIDNY